MYCSYYIAYTAFAVAFTIASTVAYIEVKETEESAVAEDRKEDDRGVFWARRGGDSYCTTSQSNRTSNKGSTAVISAEPLSSHACKPHRRCSKRSLDKIEIDRVSPHDSEGDGGGDAGS
jgi:hypothetical protein